MTNCGCSSSNRTWDAPRKATTTTWKDLRKAARSANWSAQGLANPTAYRLPMTTAMGQTTAMAQITVMTTITPLIPMPITPWGPPR